MVASLNRFEGNIRSVERDAEQVLQGIIEFLERRYKLKVHLKKTKIVDSYIESFTFLGFEFKPSGYLGISEKKRKSSKKDKRNY